MEGMTTKQKIGIFGLLGLYVICGFLTPIILEYIKMQGGAEPYTLMYTIPHSLAMVFVLFNYKEMPKIEFFKKFPKQIFVMAFFDVVSAIMTLFGMLMCGSGMYIVIYSSLTIWSAIFLRIFIKRKMNLVQIVGVTLSTVGLAISGFSAINADTEFYVGMIIVFVGTIMHSCVYWLNEIFHIKYGINMQAMCGWTGIIGVCFFLVYELCVTVPMRQKWIIDPVTKKGGVWWQILLIYAAMVFVEWLHMYAQYTVVPCVGSVTTGVGKTISSGTTFILSHVLFCKDNKMQCMTVFKVASCVIVVVGVLVYSIGKVIDKKKVKNEEVIYQDEDQAVCYSKGPASTEQSSGTNQMGQDDNSEEQLLKVVKNENDQ